MKRRIVSLVIAVTMVLAMLPTASQSVQAATTSSYAPYAKIETDYSETVTYGTVRYMSQISSSAYFNSNYWGNWAGQARIECGTCCISMSLSYVGVNKTPDDILDAGNGTTYFGSKWGGVSVNSYSASDIKTAVSRYVDGNGKYSPPIIHLNEYSSAGHFVIIVGRISDSEYQVVDPGNSVVSWNITISGTTATYNHPKTGSYITDSIDRSGRTDDIYQYYNESAIVCSHEIYDSLGVCTSCGAVFDWESTFNSGVIGIYSATRSFTPRTDKPYDAAAKADYQVAAGEKVEVVAYYENAFGNIWFKIRYNGKTGYVYEPYLEYVGLASLKVKCTDFSPVDQAVLEKKAQPVIGTVNSNYPLSAIYAYLDGTHYASWHAGNKSTTQVSLRETDINYNLPFGSLLDGKHTIELIAHSFAHDTGVNFHSSVFYINQKTEEDVRPGKPTLNVSVDGDYVTFTWGSTSNTTHYNLWLAKKNGDAEWEEVEQIFYAENGLARTLEAGEYRAQLLSYNSNAWEPDDSDWMHTWADDVFFSIEPETYTVTFNANGGTGAPTSQTEQCGTMMTLSSTVPSRFGLNFMGWALTADATTAYSQPGDTFQADSDITLYAVWNVELLSGGVGFDNTAYIDYSGVGCYYRFIPEYSASWRIYSTGTNDSRVYVYDAYGNLLASDDDSGGSRQFLLDYSFSANEVYLIYVDFYNSSLTGEVPFSIVQGYNVSYDANGGEGAPDGFIKYLNVDTTLSTTVPIRDGYTFLGWANDPNATSAAYCPGDSFTVNADTILYAVWKSNAAEADPQIIVGSAQARPGELVSITIALKNNPGIASLKLRVNYGNQLTLTDVSYNTAIGGQFQQPQTLSNPVTLNWINGTADSTGDWTFATLTLRVPETAHVGNCFDIIAFYNLDDVYNISDENVLFRVVCGTVEVTDYLPGDINGDGTVNNRDVTRLFQYLSDWDVAVNEAALDVNGDGSINNRDLTRLFQYLSDWNVEIH